MKLCDWLDELPYCRRQRSSRLIGIVQNGLRWCVCTYLCASPFPLALAPTGHHEKAACAEGNVFWSDQNQVFDDEEERPVLSRNQALNKFAQYILSFRILDSNHRVVSYG